MIEARETDARNWIVEQAATTPVRRLFRVSSLIRQAKKSWTIRAMIH
jgi:hypothetical protein